MFFKGIVAKRKKNGFGLVYFKDGDKYLGQLDERGVFQGKGVYSFVNGNHYEGLFKAGNLHGYGVYSYKNGSSEESFFH